MAPIALGIRRWVERTGCLLALGLLASLAGCAIEAEFYGAEARQYPTPQGVVDVYVSVGADTSEGGADGQVLASGPGLEPPSGPVPFVHCWLYPAPLAQPSPVDDDDDTRPARSPAILFCHGAQTQIDTIGPALAPMAQRAGAALMLVSYRGFGKSSPAEPSRASTTADALAALAALRARPEIDPDRIVVMGYSLGGVPAMACAARVRVAGVVVGGTYATAAAALRDREKGYLAWLLGDSGDPALNAQRIIGPAPLYLFHGEGDFAVPVYHAYSIASAASSAGVPVRLDVVPGAGHRSIFRDDPRLMDRLAGFVKAVTAKPARTPGG